MAKTDFQAPPDLRIVGSRLSIAGEAQFSLAAMGTAKMPDGALVYVQSVKAYFQLDKGSTATPDGSTVVNAALGPGNWVRRASDFAGDSPWMSQTDWYVNETSGSDDNDGATAATALKTIAEIQRRLGDDPLIDDTTYNVWIQSDLTEPIIFSAQFKGDNAAIWFHGGVKTVLASDVITSWVSLVPGSEPSIVGTAITDFSGYAGRRCTLTSGARAGDHFWLGESANSGAVANEDWRHGNLATYTPFGFNAVGAPNFSSVTTAPAPGDSFQIEELYLVPNINLRSNRIDNGNDGQTAMAGFIVSDLVIKPGAAASNVFDHHPVASGGPPGRGQPLVYACGISSDIAGTTVNLTGCSGYNGSGLAGFTPWNMLVYMLGYVGTVLDFRGCAINRAIQVLLDANSSLLGALEGSYTTGRGVVSVGIWRTDNASRAVLVDETSTVQVADVWGASTGTSPGFEVDGSMYAPAIANISTLAVTGNDAEVGGTVRTYAQLPYVEPANNAMIVLDP